MTRTRTTSPGRYARQRRLCRPSNFGTALGCSEWCVRLKVEARKAGQTGHRSPPRSGEVRKIRIGRRDCHILPLIVSVTPSCGFACEPREGHRLLASRVFVGHWRSRHNKRWQCLPGAAAPARVVAMTNAIRFERGQPCLNVAARLWDRGCKAAAIHRHRRRPGPADAPALVLDRRCDPTKPRHRS